MRCATDRGCARCSRLADRDVFAIFVHFGCASLSIERMRVHPGHRFADLRCRLAAFAIAGWTAALSAHAASSGDGWTAAEGSLERRIAACAACHGKQGEGLRANEYYPAIAGKPAGYLYNQLRNFRDRRRRSAVMTYMVENLSDAYLREISDHYAKLPAQPSPPVPAPPGDVLARGEALVKKGDPARHLPACSACHGENLRGMEPAIPSLVGLDPRYVAAQMGAWRSNLRRSREPDCMSTVASLLQPGDISAVTAWLGAQAASPRDAPLAAGSLKLPLDCGGLDGR